VQLYVDPAIKELAQIVPVFKIAERPVNFMDDDA